MSFLPGNNPISKGRFSRKERIWRCISNFVVKFSEKYPYKWPSVFKNIKHNSSTRFDRFVTVVPPKNTAINIVNIFHHQSMKSF